MSIYHAQDPFDPPLTTQEKKQHWGTPPPSAGPIARPLSHPLVDGSGRTLLPVLARSLKAKIAADERTDQRTVERTGANGENTVASAPAVNLDEAFRFGYDHRARQLQAQVLWEFTATFSRKAAGWIKGVAARFFGRSGEVSSIVGEVKNNYFLTNAEQDGPRLYWERRARFFGAGL